MRKRKTQLRDASDYHRQVLSHPLRHAEEAVATVERGFAMGMCKDGSGATVLYSSLMEAAEQFHLALAHASSVGAGRPGAVIDARLDKLDKAYHAAKAKFGKLCLRKA